MIHFAWLIIATAGGMIVGFLIGAGLMWARFDSRISMLDDKADALKRMIDNLPDLGQKRK